MRRIELSGVLGVGRFALVDDEDYELLCQSHWYLNNSGYARRVRKIKGVVRPIMMHRLLSSTPESEECDHIDGDRLNNQKSNLRNVSKAENRLNKGMYKNNKSGYKGVHWCNERLVWIARISAHGTHYRLGKFQTAEEASAAYMEASIKYHGEFARLNVV